MKLVIGKKNCTTIGLVVICLFMFVILSEKRGGGFCEGAARALCWCPGPFNPEAGSEQVV